MCSTSSRDGVYLKSSCMWLQKESTEPNVVQICCDCSFYMKRQGIEACTSSNHVQANNWLLKIEKLFIITFRCASFNAINGPGNSTWARPGAPEPPSKTLPIQIVSSLYRDYFIGDTHTHPPFPQAKITEKEPNYSWEIRFSC